MLLTDRWFPIPLKAQEHSVQVKLKSDIQNNIYANYVIAAGRRSFKTERFLKRYFVNSSFTYPNETNYLGAPVRKQAKEIFWKDIKELSPKYLIKNISETDLKIEYNNNTSLQVVGLKEFSTIEGGRAHRVGISEWQRCDPAVYDQTFEPMLNDTGGICIKEFRPLGKNHAYDDYLKGVNKVNGWCSYHWTAEDILSPEQIIRAKTNLALQDYRREYLADFETETGNPYYPYNELNNKSYKLDPSKAYILTPDFNATVKPMSWVLGQRYYDKYDITHWAKTFSHKFTNTETMCGILDDYLKEVGYPPVLIIYGDYRSGKAEQSNASYTDYEIITRYFSNKVKLDFRYAPCKSIRNSIGATNAQLCNSLGERKQFVDPDNCKDLILDWQKCEWAENSRELKDNDDLRGHCCRAVDYYNDVEHKIQGEVIGGQIPL